MLSQYHGVISHLGCRRRYSLFEKVTADHHLVYGNFRVSVPRADLMAEQHRHRGGERYMLFVILGQNSEHVRKELAAAVNAEKKAGSAAETQFHGVAEGSLIVNSEVESGRLSLFEPRGADAWA